MCKLCDLEFQKKVKQFLGRTNVSYRDYPEDIKEYVNWCSKELSCEEGVYLSEYDKKVTLVAISDDPFCAGFVNITFCPHCGRKLDGEELNG